MIRQGHGYITMITESHYPGVTVVPRALTKSSHGYAAGGAREPVISRPDRRSTLV